MIQGMTYRLKSSPNKTETVAHVDTDFVHFEAGGMIKKSDFSSRFEPALEIGTSPNFNTPSNINESAKTGNNFTNSEHIDPEAFFNTGANAFKYDLIKEINNPGQNDMQESMKTADGVIIPPETAAKLRRMREESSIVSPNETPVFENNIPKIKAPAFIPEQDEDDYVQPVQSAQVNAVPANRTHTPPADVQFSAKKPAPQYQNQHVAQADPISAIMRTMKRNYTKVYKINIEHVMPDPKILMLLDNGIEGSLLDNIVDEMMEKINSDPLMLREKIMDQLYKTVYGRERNDKKNNTKARAKKKSAPVKRTNKRVGATPPVVTGGDVVVGA